MSSSETPSMTGATAILVLGMHRSGTSATTRVLNLLGAELGANLLEAQADNAKGFWEHAEAVQIHDELLAAFGRTWHDVREMPENWLEQPASYAAIDKIVRLIRRDFANKKLWAVKDPRMCRLAPLWKQALKRLGVRATALIVVRKPAEVAGSLHVREGWSVAQADLMWIQHSLEAVRYTRDMPRAVLSYDDLMANWRLSINRIGDELGIEWPNQTEEAFGEIDAFLTPEDQHHRSGDFVEADAASPAPSIPEQLYALSLDVASGKANWSALSEFDHRYEEMAGLFREVTDQKYDLDNLALDRIKHIRLVENEVDSVGKQLDHVRALATERDNHIQLLAAQHQGLVDSVAQRQERIDQLESQGATTRSELLATKKALEEITAAHRQLVETFEALSQRCIELDEALRDEQEMDTAAFIALERLRERSEALSRTFELTFSRRWLVRRLWDVTTKGSFARKHNA